MFKTNKLKILITIKINTKYKCIKVDNICIQFINNYNKYYFTHFAILFKNCPIVISLLK